MSHRSTGGEGDDIDAVDLAEKLIRLAKSGMMRLRSPDGDLVVVVLANADPRGETVRCLDRWYEEHGARCTPVVHICRGSLGASS